jgi:hypothetical protein
MLRALAHSGGRKALLVLPYVTMCHERSKHLRPLMAPLNREVRCITTAATLPLCRP